MKRVKCLAFFLSLLFIVSAVGCKKSDKGNGNSDLTSQKAVIAGWLMDAEEKLLAEKSVKLIDVETDAALTTTTDSNGEYYFNDLNAGEYKLSVANDDGNDVTSSETYTVEEGQNLYLKIVFDGSTLQITVIDNNTSGDANASGTGGAGTVTNSNASKSGSGNSSGKNPKTGKASGKGKDETLESLRGTTIKVLDWNALGSVTGAKEAVNKFQKKTGIKVDYIVKAHADYASSLASMVAADQAPDVVRVRALNPAILKQLQPIDVTGLNYNDDVWDKRVSKQFTVNGNVYAVNRKDTLLQLPTVMYYNTSYISKYSLDDPYNLWKNGKWTWQNFIRLCTEFKDEAGSGYTPWSPFGVLLFASQKGIPVSYAKNGRLVSNYNNDAIKATQEFLGYKSSGIAGAYADNNGFDQGKYLFLTASIIDSRVSHFGITGLKSKNALGAVPYPTLDGKSHVVVFQECQAFGVAKGAKNPKAVPYYLEYYLNPQYYEEKTFFNSSKILDVYKSLMKCENYNFFDDVINPITEPGGSMASADYQELKVATAEQANVIMNRMKAPYEAGIKKINDGLAEIK